MKCLLFSLLFTFNHFVKPLPKGDNVKIHPAATVCSPDDVCPDDLLYFAQTLIGTRYRSASSNPLYGFDCSGFVSYVFKYFNFSVPRSSCEFINVGEKVKLEDAKPGDIILFTGTSKKAAE